MDLHLCEKVAVICGGTTGIGRATAEAFAAEGCRVAVCSRSQAKVDAFCADFDRLGASYFAAAADASHKAELDRFADEAAARFGGIDIWVNCAGGNRHGPLDSLAPEDVRFIVDINLTTMINGYQAAARHMIPRRSGVIVNVASLSGKEGVAYRALYGAVKAGIINLTATTAAELAPYGIRTVSVSPGVVNTALMTRTIEESGDRLRDRICLRRPADPREIALPIVFLASDAASYITGTNLNIHGGKQNVEDASLPWLSPWGTPDGKSSK